MGLFRAFFPAFFGTAPGIALFKGIFSDPVEEFPCDHSLVIAEVAVGIELRTQRTLFRILFLIIGQRIFIQFFGRRYAAVVRRVVLRFRKIRKIREVLSAVSAFRGRFDLLESRKVFGSHIHLKQKLFPGQDLSFQVDGGLGSVILQKHVTLLYMLSGLYQDRIHALSIHQIYILGKARGHHAFHAVLIIAPGIVQIRHGHYHDGLSTAGGKSPADSVNKSRCQCQTEQHCQYPVLLHYIFTS